MRAQVVVTLPATLALVWSLIAAAAPATRSAPVIGYYEGDLPCADCAGIRHRLQLRADQAFILQMEYLGKPGAEAATRSRFGTWEVAKDGRLTLRSPGEEPMIFAMPAPGILRKLDMQARPIPSKLNYELRRLEPRGPFEPILRLDGMYTYLADAGLFQECHSGARWPVVHEADNAALERGYAGLRAEPGQALLVTLDVRLVQRPKADGDGLQDSLVVARYIGAWPGESCGSALATAKLINTDWKATRLGDRPVIVPPLGRGPRLRLSAQGNRVDGFGGCNTFMGTFKSRDRSLTFGRLASTMMACPDTMDQEQAFLEALRVTVTWKIIGQHLELGDRDGTTVARLEAQ